MKIDLYKISRLSTGTDVLFHRDKRTRKKLSTGQNLLLTRRRKKMNPYKQKDQATIYENMSEHEHQRELFSWAAAVQRYGIEASLLWALSEPRTLKRDKPGCIRVPDDRLRWLHSIPNSGHGRQGQGGAIRGNRMKVEGLKKGVADVFLPLPSGAFHGLYIELKTFKGRLSEEQKEFASYAASVGYHWTVATGYWEAIHSILMYLGEKEMVAKYFA